MATDVTATLLTTLSRSKRLPSPPGTALRVLELARSEDVDIKELTDTVRADPALASRMLRYANSVLVGAAREVTTVRDAILYLGLRTVKLTALGFGLATTLELDCPGFSLQRYWGRSLMTATIARRFADEFGADREEAFTVGLLARIGQLALAQGIPEAYARVLAHASDDDAALVAAERRELGTDHVEFGAALLSQWEVPTRLVQPVRYRLEPSRAVGPAIALARTVRTATTLTPLFCHRQDPMPEQRAMARTTIQEVLKLDEAAWDNVATELLAEYREMSGVFDIEVDQAAVFDLYAEAQEEATRVGIVAQLEKERAMEQARGLLKLATTDELTGVSNRNKLQERLDELVAGLPRNHGHFAVLMFDVDHFKQVNDQYGHGAGDLVLWHVAHALRRILREVDLVARYGGEEFVILAPRTDQLAACTLAARARKCIDELRIDYEGETLQVTISLGMVITSDYKAWPTADELLRDADRQLYLAKNTGRNTWSYLDRCATTVAGGRN